MSQEMRVDDELMLESGQHSLERVGARGQSQVIRTKAQDGKSGGPMSALPFRNNLIPALNEDEVSLGVGEGRMNQEDYDEAPIGEDFSGVGSTSANTKAVKGNHSIINQVSRSQQPDHMPDIND